MTVVGGLRMRRQSRGGSSNGNGRGSKDVRPSKIALIDQKQLAADLGVGYSTLRSWFHRYHPGAGQGVFKGPGAIRIDEALFKKEFPLLVEKTRDSKRN